jgi:hypothetical protein
MVFAVFAPAASAQEGEPLAVESFSAEAAAPAMEQAVELDAPPVLSEEELARMEWAAENMNLPGPAIDMEAAAEPAGPPPETESALGETRDRSGEPLAPGDAIQFKWKQFGGSIPSGFKSNIMESSLDGKSRRLFYSGNWFGARSTDKGSNWTFVDPRPGFPSWGPFCCDQVVLHDGARDIFIWLRMGVPGTNPNTGNYENLFKLSIDFRQPFEGSYWTYTFAPTSTNGDWTGQWWDYPHMQLGADYLYIAWNMFNQAGAWTRTVMLRFPLDALAAASGFGYNYYQNTSWFTFLPVSGANHTMYFASNWPSPYSNTNLGIWRWDENSAGLTFWNRTITAYTPTGRGNAVCGSPNWAARYDQRVLAGARYTINGSNLLIRGRKVLGWWWNVQEGGNFPYPYIEGAAFYEDNITQVAGNQGRPLVWNSTTCFAYPMVEANKRQDLGLVFNYGQSPDYHKPCVGWALADDYAAAPAGWTYFGAACSGAGSSTNTWGDYNTTRAYQDLQAWIAGAHYIPGSTNCSNCSTPLFWAFGRERDFWGGFKLW